MKNKRLLSLFMAAAMVFSILPMTIVTSIPVAAVESTVATVNGTAYTSFADAMTAFRSAGAGAELVLCTDITNAEDRFNFSDNTVAKTIDLGGHTLTLEKTIWTNGDFTIKNGAIVNNTVLPLRIYGGTTDLNGVDISTTASVNVINVQGTNPVLNITDCDISSTQNKAAINVESTATLTINSGSVTNAGKTATNPPIYARGTVYLKGGTYTAGNTTAQTVCAFGSASKVYISGGVFNSGLVASSGKFFITGGSFKTNVSTWVVDGYLATQDTNTGFYTVAVDTTPVIAKIGTTEYRNIAKAIEAFRSATTATELVLLGDADASAVTNWGLNNTNAAKTIDLGGFKLTTDECIQLGGDITIKNGEIINNTTSDVFRTTNGTVNLEGLTIAKTTSGNIINGQTNAANGTANVTIIDCDFSNTGAVTLIDGKNGITITIDGGSYSNAGAGWDTVTVRSYGTLTVKDGDFSAGTGSCIAAWASGSYIGQVNIEGGTFTTIQSGKFSDASSNGEFTITGGSFAAENVSNYLSDDYKIVLNSTTNLYDVVVNNDPYLAQIGSTQYRDIKKAFAAFRDATSDVTITLLADATLPGVWNFSTANGTKRTIDLGGFTLTTESQMQLGGDFTFKNGTVVNNRTGNVFRASNGNVKFDGVTVERTSEALILSAQSNDGNIVYVTLDNCKFTNTTGALVVDGHYTSNVTINSGTYTNQSTFFLNNAVRTTGTMTINGGVFSSGDSIACVGAWGTMGSEATPLKHLGQMTINGGEFTTIAENKFGGCDENGTVIVAGGIYKQNVTSKAVAGKSVMTLDDGRYLVYTALTVSTGGLNVIVVEENTTTIEIPLTVTGEGAANASFFAKLDDGAFAPITLDGGKYVIDNASTVLADAKKITIKAEIGETPASVGYSYGATVVAINQETLNNTETVTDIPEWEFKVGSEGVRLVDTEEDTVFIPGNRYLYLYDMNYGHTGVYFGSNIAAPDGYSYQVVFDVATPLEFIQGHVASNPAWPGLGKVVGAVSGLTVQAGGGDQWVLPSISRNSGWKSTSFSYTGYEDFFALGLDPAYNTDNNPMKLRANWSIKYGLMIDNLSIVATKEGETPFVLFTEDFENIALGNCSEKGVTISFAAVVDAFGTKHSGGTFTINAWQGYGGRDLPELAVEEDGTSYYTAAVGLGDALTYAPNGGTTVEDDGVYVINASFRNYQKVVEEEAALTGAGFPLSAGYYSYSGGWIVENFNKYTVNAKIDVTTEDGESQVHYATNTGTVGECWTDLRFAFELKEGDTITNLSFVIKHVKSGETLDPDLTETVNVQFKNIDMEYFNLDNGDGGAFGLFAIMLLEKKESGKTGPTTPNKPIPPTYKVPEVSGSDDPANPDGSDGPVVDDSNFVELYTGGDFTEDIAIFDTLIPKVSKVGGAGIYTKGKFSLAENTVTQVTDGENRYIKVTNLNKNDRAIYINTGLDLLPGTYIISADLKIVGGRDGKEWFKADTQSMRINIMDPLNATKDVYIRPGVEEILPVDSNATLDKLGGVSDNCIEVTKEWTKYLDIITIDEAGVLTIKIGGGVKGEMDSHDFYLDNLSIRGLAENVR